MRLDVHVLYCGSCSKATSGNADQVIHTIVVAIIEKRSERDKRRSDDKRQYLELTLQTILPALWSLAVHERLLF